MNEWMLVVTAVLGAGAPYLVAKIWPRMWHGTFEYARLRPTPGWWPWGNVLWRAWVRAWLPASFFLIIAALAVPGAFWSEGSDFARNAPLWYDVALVVVSLAWAAGIISIVLVNRPHFLIPPRLRAEPGLIADIIATKRARPREPAD